METIRILQYIGTLGVVSFLLFTYYNMWRQIPKNRRQK